MFSFIWLSSVFCGVAMTAFIPPAIPGTYQGVLYNLFSVYQSNACSGFITYLNATVVSSSGNQTLQYQDFTPTCNVMSTGGSFSTRNYLLDVVDLNLVLYNVLRRDTFYTVIKNSDSNFEVFLTNGECQQVGHGWSSTGSCAAGGSGVVVYPNTYCTGTPLPQYLNLPAECISFNSDGTNSTIGVTTGKTSHDTSSASSTFVSTGLALFIAACVMLGVF